MQWFSVLDCRYGPRIASMCLRESQYKETTKMHPLTRLKRVFGRLAPAVLLLAVMAPAHAVQVWTHSYNNQRTGANTSETVLTDSNVNVNQFGRLFNCPVDDQMYASTLYMPSITINGAVHNVVYCCTMSNSVYCFDADNGA